MTLLRPRPAQARSAWAGEDSERLARGLGELSLNASAAQLSRLRIYGELLLKWNRTYNLLGATDVDTLVRDHLLDSLATIPALQRWLPPDGVLVDVGSGAGLPGLVLAIMLDPLPITLVEPNGKKAAFLRQVVAHCSLSTVEVVEARIEDMDRKRAFATKDSAGPVTVPSTAHFICRAFTSLDRFAALCRPQLSKQSILFAMKAARVAEELEDLDEWLEVLAVEPLHAVGKDVQRNLVVMQSKTIDNRQPHNTADQIDGSAAGGLLGNHSHDR